MKLRSLFLNLGVLLASVVVGSLLCEGGLRLILNSSDYLEVEMINDPILGATPSPHSRSGFDAWGFRNKKVPDHVDIVAIGDSHTYGNTARMEDSWPYVVSRMTGRSVYNMGLGGYGPNQYAYLLQRALTLKPRLVICGLYMGDDFENAFLITYGLDHWAYLRKLPNKNVDSNIWPKSESRSFGAVREWLARNSVLYQLLFHGPVSGLLQGDYRITHAPELYPGNATALSLPEKNILEAFLPVAIYHRIDQNSRAIQDGMRITFQLLKEMNEKSHQNGADFLVVVIPTKESVFSEYLEHNSKLPLDDVLDQVIAFDRQARSKLFEALSESGIPYVDALPALRQEVGHQLYARTPTDMHPGKNGYRVIGTAVSDFLKKSTVVGATNLTRPQPSNQN